MEINIRDLQAGMGLSVVPVGPATPVGSHNVYQVANLYTGSNGAYKEVVDSQGYDPIHSHYLVFQDGHPDVHGINGLTSEALLLAVADRLAAFQKNELSAAPETQAALDHIKQAVYALNQRTIRLNHEAELKQ